MLLVYALVLFVAALCRDSQRAFAQAKKTPLPPARELIDYSTPPREYVTAQAGTRSVLVEKQLMTEAPVIARQALARLGKKLREASAALPEHARGNLKELPIYLMYGPKAKGGGHDSGLVYFQKNAPKNRKNLDPRWGSSVVIYSAENYAKITEFWALKSLVHEFAHAHQLEQWPEDQLDILQAWENATQRGLYRGVKDDKGKAVDKAYASVNQLEYFAELSCMYFVGCNYQPFNRKELETYDPVGYAMIQKTWGLK